MITQALGTILTLLRIVALGWGIMMLIIIAVKLIAPDKPEVKSMLKEDLPTYVIGAVMLFGASGVLTFFTYLVKDFFG